MGTKVACYTIWMEETKGTMWEVLFVKVIYFQKRRKKVRGEPWGVLGENKTYTKWKQRYIFGGGVFKT